MLGEALALSAAVVWSTSIILFKRSEAIRPLGMNLFKNVVGTLLLGATLLVIGRGFDTARPASDWARLIASGVLGIGVADTLIFTALRRLGPVIGERDPLQAYCDVLEHKWLLSEQAGRDVGLDAAIAAYLAEGAPAPEPISVAEPPG